MKRSSWHGNSVDPALVNERIVAIDIGNQGGIVFNSDGKLLIYEINEDLEELFQVISGSYAQVAIAENVHTWAGQGIVSQGTLMENKGVIKGMLVACGIPAEFIEPLKWIEHYTVKRRKHFNNIREFKKHLGEIAKEHIHDRWIDQINLQTCDAFLMWNYRAAISIGQPLEKYGSKLKFK